MFNKCNRYFKRILICIVFFKILFLVFYIRFFRTESKQYKSNFKSKLVENNPETWYQEWEVLNDTFYFKKSAAYLFKDSNYTYIYFISKIRFKETFNLRLKIYDLKTQEKLTEVNLKDQKCLKYNSWGNDHSDHGFYVLKGYFNEINILKKYLNDEKKLSIHAFPFISDQTITHNPIDLKIKNLREKDELKKEIMICTKMVSIEPKDYKMFEDWILINRKFGYEKIVLYNNSIPNRDNFNDLIFNNQDILELKQNKFYPDIINNSNVFIENYLKIIDPKSFARGIYEVLLMNECYLDNIDKFKYIEVIDTDELIIPRVLENYFPLEEMTIFNSSKNFHFFQKFCNHLDDIGRRKSQNEITITTKNNIIDYIYKLKHLFNIGKSDNIYFYDANYISNEIVVKLFQQVEKLNIVSKNFSSPYFIEVEYPINNNNNNIKMVASSISIKLTFRILNKKQNDYMNYLYDFYRKFFIKFFDKIKDSEASNLNRFFYIASSAINPGKTIYQTNEYVIIDSHHRPSGPYKMRYINYNYGQSSHFRNNLKLENLKDNNWILDISQLYFDMNYFNYYYV